MTGWMYLRKLCYRWRDLFFQVRPSYLGTAKTIKKACVKKYAFILLFIVLWIFILVFTWCILEVKVCQLIWLHSQSCALHPCMYRHKFSFTMKLTTTLLQNLIQPIKNVKHKDDRMEQNILHGHKIHFFIVTMWLRISKPK